MISIKWKCNIIPSKVEDNLREKYIKKGYFGKIDVKNNKYSKIIYSYRKHYLKENLIKNYWKIKKKLIK